MQPAPIRLQQAIWTAFKAARPIHQRSQVTRQLFQQPVAARALINERRIQILAWSPRPSSQVRCYSNDSKHDIEKKIEDATQRIDETLDSRADNTVPSQPPEEDTLKKQQDETIIHTLPESSSIVHNPDAPGESAARGSAIPPGQEDGRTHATTAWSHRQQHESPPSPTATPLPSQLAARYSQARERFTHFMENFQVHIFTASKRLNDLTGYTSIEQLKRDIEEQENNVRQSRQHVKDTRDAYQGAISQRSDTQREVNDLLHRKHTWSPKDLERFTDLYRSDHANEHSENQAHDRLSKAEAAYEEASTRLSKSILARYHEEQVWSDKIRQMSTWGTWGLMGLNVLLFVVFQILIEPWRRRRLVKGFEQKVQEALKEQSAENELRTIFHIERARGEEPVVAAATAAAVVEAAPAEAAPAIKADAAQDGSMLSNGTTEAVSADEVAQRTNIEQAAEAVTTAEVIAETRTEAQTNTSALEASDTAVLTADPVALTDLPEGTPSPKTNLPPLGEAAYKDLPFLMGSYTRRYLNQTGSLVRSFFDERKEVVITQRDLTNSVLEGAFVGAVGVVCFFWVVGISSVKGQ